MKDSNKKNINIVSDGINAASGVLALVNPIFSVIPIIVFGVNRVINFISSDDIVSRIKKIEKKLITKQISLNDFKEKIENLDEHKRYVLSNNFNRILLECIPETVDIYISILIDYIMNSEYKLVEDLFEIIKELNSNDIKVLNNIIGYLDYGNRRQYEKSIERDRYIKEMNKEIIQKNLEARKKNEEIKKNNSNKILYIDNMRLYHEKNERYGEYTIFWKDFADYLYLNNDVNINHLLLFDYKDSDFSEWTYLAKSFIKLEKLGLIEIESLNTVGAINSLFVDRFHLTSYCLKIFEYIKEK